MVDAGNDYWMPMDQYIGGIEHAILHLLYARFWTKVMRDMGLVKFDEPFTRLFTQGMLLAECFYREDGGKRRWFYPSEVEVRHDDKGKPAGAVAHADGAPVMPGGIEKMSKSKNNVVEPGDIIRRFGADTARAYVMFAGPPIESAVWSDSGAEGVHRFLRRLWTFAVKHAEIIGAGGKVAGSLSAPARSVRREIHLSLRQACFDYERLQYNTVVSAAMKMLNALEGVKLEAVGNAAVLRESMGILLRTLYPTAPHISSVLWDELGFESEHGGLLDAPWPEPDPAALQQDEIELVVQVNGKLRGSIRVPAAADRDIIVTAALNDAHVRKFVADQPIKKTIVVPGKLVNIVV
jgi:leucyl-tRNA synthetase